QNYFVFGDAHMDIGNDILLPFGSSLRSNYYPYGIDNNNMSTGRWSNDYVLGDFFSEKLTFGVTIYTPYILFSGGTNFAVAGATALNRSTLACYGIQSLDVPYLLMQLDWYELYLANHPDYLYDTVIGPIGGNDIIYAITQCNKTYNEISSMIPMIAETIVTVLNKV
ncbi:hypothetical protein M569_09589, partial [Genlisea aurea]